MLDEKQLDAFWNDEGAFPLDTLAKVFAQARDAIAFRAQVGKLADALARYRHCRHGCQDCFCTKEAKAVLTTDAQAAGEELAALREKAADRDAGADALTDMVNAMEEAWDATVGVEGGEFLLDDAVREIEAWAKALQARVAELAADDLTHRERIAELEALPKARPATAVECWNCGSWITLAAAAADRILKEKRQ